ncbi:sulfurtransferase [Microbacterium hominis]|uniref:Sulfurtransferase n=1 Tax=Microbacterium hominis TaxID=162426 RepID=A0A7D4PXN7_9MICO|nr:sulfurtransferase [Microbacterium hominis]
MDAGALADLLARDARVRLLDVRWRIDRPDGRAEYLQAHLPGAVHVDLERELSRHGEPAEGRHPLPGRDALQDAARRWGLRRGDAVVVYDDAGSVPAARAWWMLTRSGLADVRVLDGGLAAWRAAGLPVEAGAVAAERGDVVLQEISTGVVDIDQAAARAAEHRLVDVRAPARYRGETEPIDPVAGHIPGAVNLPTLAHIVDGRFRSPEEIRAAFAAVGIAPGVGAAASCGSGVNAAHSALAAAVAGIDLDVYVGSWSQWCNTPGRPVAIGDEPAASRG